MDAAFEQAAMQNDIHLGHTGVELLGIVQLKSIFAIRGRGETARPVHDGPQSSGEYQRNDGYPE